MIRLKINLTKVDESAVFVGKNGARYLDVLVWENDKPDQFGNALRVVQALSKERRDKGDKGPILGDGNFLGKRHARRPENPPPATKTYTHMNQPAEDMDSMPF